MRLGFYKQDFSRCWGGQLHLCGNELVKPRGIDSIAEEVVGHHELTHVWDVGMDLADDAQLLQCKLQQVCCLLSCRRVREDVAKL